MTSSNRPGRSWPLTGPPTRGSWDDRELLPADVAARVEADRTEAEVPQSGGQALAQVGVVQPGDLGRVDLDPGGAGACPDPDAREPVAEDQRLRPLDPVEKLRRDRLPAGDPSPAALPRATAVA